MHSMKNTLALAHREADDRIVELIAPSGGARILLHQAARSQKMGQVLVKLGFDVEDIEGFAAESAAKGLKFGARHKGDGYTFANTKDPSGNSVAISSRAFWVKHGLAIDKND